MSKELAERLRADAESTDDIGLCADAAGHAIRALPGVTLEDLK